MRTGTGLPLSLFFLFIFNPAVLRLWSIKDTERNTSEASETGTWVKGSGVGLVVVVGTKV